MCESRSGRPVPNNNGRKAKLSLNRAVSHRVVLCQFYRSAITSFALLGRGTLLV